MNILIGNAWPYANGSLHIGHLAALLPGDVLARYFRSKGDTVFFVSGSDCHGTPVTIRAVQENKTPDEISSYYHSEFISCFERLGFSYDLYDKTSNTGHKEFVRDFHEKLYNGGYVYEKSTPQAYCSKCSRFLPDRFVEGSCPECFGPARGDQCESCGKVLDSESLIEPRCNICSTRPEFRYSDHLFLAVSKMKDQLEGYINDHTEWRKNAYEMSKRYIIEGLRDRSLTRDLNWGIDVPKNGFEGKKIYIWAENVLGYLSTCHTLCLRKKIDFYEYWNSCRQYYVHGKDNIPFHTIILPSLLLGRTDMEFKLPDQIISSEYLTLEGRKISTSSNWAIWVKDIIKKYDPDSIRYFLIANGPEKRDTDFTYREFINSHNGELLGAYGNFINRSLVFIKRFFDSEVPLSQCDADISTEIKRLYPKTADMIEQGNFKEALETIFSFIRSANKYFDNERPWITIKTNYTKCEETLYTCVQIIANLSILLEPFLPFSSEKVRGFLKMNAVKREYHVIRQGTIIEAPEILFNRVDT